MKQKQGKSGRIEYVVRRELEKAGFDPRKQDELLRQIGELEHQIQVLEDAVKDAERRSFWRRLLGIR